MQSPVLPYICISLINCGNFMPVKIEWLNRMKIWYFVFDIYMHCCDVDYNIRAYLVGVCVLMCIQFVRNVIHFDEMK